MFPVPPLTMTVSTRQRLQIPGDPPLSLVAAWAVQLERLGPESAPSLQRFFRTFYRFIDIPLWSAPPPKAGGSGGGLGRRHPDKSSLESEEDDWQIGEGAKVYPGAACQCCTCKIICVCGPMPDTQYVFFCSLLHIALHFAALYHSRTPLLFIANHERVRFR